jgi:hypothetical protein
MTTREPTLRQAALIAGVGLLLMAAMSPFAEFHVYPKIVQGGADQTAQNIAANQGLFIAGILSYLFNFVLDVPVAWALYVLLKPVSVSVSLLTAWFRLVYTAIAVVALLNLVTALRLVTTPEYAAALSPTQLHALMMASLRAFRDGWGIALMFFGVHLVMLGVLVYRSTHVPKVLGVLLVIAGLGYVTFHLGPYILPKTDLGFLFVTFFGEMFFMLWLLIRGWKIPQP